MSLSPFVYLPLFYLQGAALLIMLSKVHEAFDATCRVRQRRVSPPVVNLGAAAPKVCLLVPVYNEPIEMVEQTAGSLARLNYPDYEVLLVDHTNNPAFWRALERLRGEWG